jgi:hypothetical protein
MDINRDDPSNADSGSINQGANWTDEEDSRVGDAHESALELMKQLITLASGVLALSATFLAKVSFTRWWLVALLAASWLALLISVFCGLETISAIVKSRLNQEYDWSRGYGRRCALISKYAFVAGISIFALFAIVSLLSPGGQSSTHFSDFDVP